MTSKAQETQKQRGSRQSGKMLWRSGSSLAAAAFLLASAPQAAQAQGPLRAPGMMMENAPHGSNVSIRRPEIAESQRFDRAPDFHARNIRISAPLNPLPVHNVRISAPAGMVAINEAQAVAPRVDPNRSFQANPTSASAFATVAPTATQDIVTVFGPETFINWSPQDSANSDDLINILPAGTTMTFVGPTSRHQRWPDWRKCLVLQSRRDRGRSRRDL